MGPSDTGEPWGRGQGVWEPTPGVAAHLHPLIEPEDLGRILISVLLQDLVVFRLVRAHQGLSSGCSLQQGCCKDFSKGSIVVVTQQPQWPAHMLLHIQQNSSTTTCMTSVPGLEVRSDKGIVSICVCSGHAAV